MTVRTFLIGICDSYVERFRQQYVDYFRKYILEPQKLSSEFTKERLISQANRLVRSRENLDSFVLLLDLFL